MIHYSCHPPATTRICISICNSCTHPCGILHIHIVCAIEWMRKLLPQTIRHTHSRSANIAAHMFLAFGMYPHRIDTPPYSLRECGKHPSGHIASHTQLLQKCNARHIAENPVQNSTDIVCIASHRVSAVTLAAAFLTLSRIEIHKYSEHIYIINHRVAS